MRQISCKSLQIFRNTGTMMPCQMMAQVSKNRSISWRLSCNSTQWSKYVSNCKKMSGMNYQSLLKNIFLDGIKAEWNIYLTNLLTKKIFPTNKDTSSQTKVKHMVSPGTLRLFQSSKKRELSLLLLHQIGASCTQNCLEIPLAVGCSHLM
jgi:hypothetical protein